MIASIIPIVAIVTSLGVPALVIILIVSYNHKKKLAQYDLVERALKSETSPEVMNQLIESIGEKERKPSSAKEKNLIHAVILLALGISFFLLQFLLGVSEESMGLAATGAILTMLGIAKLVIAFLIIGKTRDSR